MTLLELCEPIFQSVCRVNRIARAKGNLAYLTARTDVKELLEDVATKANSNTRLKLQYQKIKLPLLFFIDAMIVESGISCAAEWDQNRLGYEHNELAGDEAFFDFLEETASDTSEEGSERLAFFYTCLGLGFSGFYAGQPEYLRQKMMEIAPRIRHLVDTDNLSRICPDAYEHLNTSNLVEPPAPKIFGITIAFASLFVVIFISVIYLFNVAISDLSNALQDIAKYAF